MENPFRPTVAHEKLPHTVVSFAINQCSTTLVDSDQNNVLEVACKAADTQVLLFSRHFGVSIFMEDCTMKSCGAAILQVLSSRTAFDSIGLLSSGCIVWLHLSDCSIVT